MHPGSIPGEASNEIVKLSIDKAFDADGKRRGFRRQIKRRPRLGRNSGRASMATKADFTADEWKLLMQSPLVAGVAISAADPSGLIGMLRESMASARALLDAKADPNADALVKAVAGEFETSAGRGLAQDGVRAAISGAKAPADIVSKALELPEGRRRPARRQGRPGRRPLQDLARRRGQIGRRSGAGRRLPRLWRDSGQRNGKGDGRSHRRRARGPGPGGLGPSRGYRAGAGGASHDRPGTGLSVAHFPGYFFRREMEHARREP